MKRVILDTNFLIIPGEFGVDIFSEIERVMDSGYQIFVFDKTIDELEGLKSKGKGRTKRNASLGLQLIKAKNVGVIKSKSNLNVDQLILQEAVPGQDIVATQDKELKRLLKSKGVALLVLRKKKFLNII
ncbi:nucleotide-binding protein [Candidatus Woesearchaeota archaeon]|nr:MAG: nucleotide-binding protein [Candidatus Woesearchaeota archaeon]